MASKGNSMAPGGQCHSTPWAAMKGEGPLAEGEAQGSAVPRVLRGMCALTVCVVRLAGKREAHGSHMRMGVGALGQVVRG